MQEEKQDINISLNWVNLIKPSRYASDKIGKNSAVFHIEPLEKGFGVTLGNSLRRILLSSLQGTAICAVKMYGVDHEYSTIDNVEEDVVEIIMNLKSVVIKGSAGYGFKKVKLSLLKKGPITAGDIKIADDFEIINPGLVICNTTKDIKIEMEFIITSGKGYQCADGHSIPDYGKDFISIDSIFSPVKQCSFKTSNSRVGSKTEYDKLSLVLETNGSLKPDLALALAAKIFQDQLQIFINFQEVKEIKKPKEKKIPFNRNLLKKVSDLELSVRSYNCLKNDNIAYIGDLVIKSESQMLKTANFGKKSLNEIKQLLNEMGLKFGMQVDNWPPKDIESLIKNCLNEESGI
jgi:DNA-directed RNA polymerase subunit alpha